MTSLRIACVVEGHGEVSAVPILLRRLALHFTPAVQLEIPHPIRMPRSSILREEELRRAVELAARQSGPGGAVLLMLDSDKDCPAELGPKLLERARRVRTDRRLLVVLPKREFETWFLAAAESLRGKRGLKADLEPPMNAESVAGAKEWLGRNMANGHYVETLDQPALAAVFDLEQAKQAPSFARFCRVMADLFREAVTH